MKNIAPLLYLLVIVLCLTGCATTQIVQLSPDTYILSRSSAAGMFANMSKLKLKIIQEANEFAQSKGKIAIPLSSNEIRPSHGFPSFEYQFRVVDKNDPEARRTHLIKSPDVSIKSDSSFKADVNIRTKEESEK